MPESPLPRAEFLASLPRRRIATGAVFRDTTDRVLIVEPTYKQTWQLPGGTVEADESPRAGCVREVREELGLDVPLGRLLVMAWHGPGPDDPHGALLIDYDGGRLTDDQIAEFVLPADELRSHRFLPVDEVGRLTTNRTARRIAAALRALNTGTPVELELS